MSEQQPATPGPPEPADPPSDEPTPGRETPPSADLALAFLDRLRPGGPWVLTAIWPDRKAIQTRTFSAENRAALRAWLEERGLHSNIYYSVNPTRQPVQKKAQREDIAALSWLHVDLDPRVGEDLAQEQGRLLRLLTAELPDGMPPPTAVVFSGGGYQALWRLREPFVIDGDLDRAEEAKLWNLALEHVLGGDQCHNVDRVLRLPGTMNWPDKKKRKKGRKPALAELVAFHEDRTYDLAAMPKAPAPTDPGHSTGSAGNNPGPARRIGNIDELRQWGVPERIRTIVARGDGRDAEGPKEGDDSRSAWLFDGVCGLVRSGVPDDVVLGILTDPELRISASVLEYGSRADAYARRQIQRARDAAAAFACDDKERPLARSQDNVRVALARLGIEVFHNEFTDRSLVEGLPGFPELTDRALVRLRLTIARGFRFEPPKDWFADVMVDMALRARFHPVRDYLDGLAWDGTPRADRWIVDYLGAEDTPYTRAVGRLLLVAAVRRVRRPGCKFDEMVVLESPQGMNKSTALRVLAVRDEWFSDDLPLGVDGKVVVERTRGKWIVEAAELKGIRGRKADQLKSFLSRQSERARLSYDRLEGDHPRHFVIVGTTNDDRYLRDRTGNRRFWPVQIGDIDLAALRRDRDQLWAEAALLEAEGESIRLDPELWAAASEEQSAREVVDPWSDLLADLLGGLSGRILVEDVWQILDRPRGVRSQDDNERLGACMRELGWERRRLRHRSKMKYFYVRGDDEEQERVLVVRGAQIFPEGEEPF